MSSRELVVVKFGSESLVNGEGIDYERINGHAERLSEVYETHDLVVITSAGVAQAKRRLQAIGGSWERYNKRTLAMMGSAGITVAWERGFERQGILAGQVLITHREMRDSVEGANFCNAYATVKRDGVVPVINYADFLSADTDVEDELQEIEKQADNDRLAKDVAIHLGANALILATDTVMGFTTQTGELIHKVAVADIPAQKKEHLLPATREGTGGMGSKLDNAGEAAVASVRTFICNADSNFARILSGQQSCTEVVQYL